MRNALLIVLIIIIIILYINYHTKEDFIVRPFYYDYHIPHFCEDCKKLTRNGCNSCFSCGYCYSSKGYSGCVAGNKDGPYFRDDCDIYEYNGWIRN